MEGDEDKNLLIGFNTSANLLEIMYYELDDGTACVYHAMPCRNKNISELNRRRNK
jgi:hypothetical protein